MCRSFLFVLVTAALAAACAPNQTSTEQALTNAGCTLDSARACDPADPKKTTVCHIPPGNPANAHTICVGNPAVDAHLAHGDVLGACDCPGDDGEDLDAGTSCPTDPGQHGDCDGSGSGSDAGTDTDCDHDTDGDGSGDCPDDGGGSGSGSGSGDGSLS